MQTAWRVQIRWRGLVPSLSGTQLLVMLTVGAAFLASCTTAERDAEDIYGQPPALEEYRRNLGELEDFLHEQSGVFPDGAGPSNAEYRAIVDAYRKEGLERLSDDERQSLLLVAQIAFLAYADTLQYSLTAEDGPAGAEGDAGDQALLEEVYRHTLLPFIAARRIGGTAISWPWVRLPAWNPEAPLERLEFFDFEIKEEDVSEFVGVTVWEKREGEWACVTSMEDGNDWLDSHLAHLGKFVDYGRGDLLGRDTVERRPAYRLTLAGDPAYYVDITYWLDAETLWLRQYEYEEEGIHYLVKLEAVNEDITIESPDVDVQCVEEEPE